MPTTEDIKQWITEAIKWHRHDGVLTQRVLLNQLFGFRRRWNDILNLNVIVFSLPGATNGTTPVTFVDTSNGATPFAFLVTSAIATALDATAGTITLKKNGSTTILTITKSTTAGVVTGNTSLNTSGTPPANQLNPNDILTVESSSAGNVFIQVQVLFPNN